MDKEQEVQEMREGKRPWTPVAALREFFSVPAKPVTNTELIEFRKQDKAGFDELAGLAIHALRK